MVRLMVAPEDLYEFPYPSADLEANYPFEELAFTRLDPPTMSERAEEFSR